MKTNSRTLRVAAIEDNADYQRVIANLLTQINANADLVLYNDAEAFLNTNEHFQLVILDIDLPKMDGITLSKNIKDRTDAIVFLSAYGNRAIEAVGMRVAKYIVKTKSDEEIICEINEVIDELSIDTSIEINTDDNEIKSIQIEEVYKISVEGRRLYLYTDHEKYRMQGRTLKDIYDKYDKKLIYVNQSVLVNPIYVTRVFKNGTVELKNGAKEFLSRSRQKEFLMELTQLVGSI